MARMVWLANDSISLDLNDEIFGHLLEERRNKVAEGQMSLVDFAEDE